jgi:hypothetical protein
LCGVNPDSPDFHLTHCAVHKIPLIHQFLELVGLAVTAVYGYRYFTDPAERCVCVCEGGRESKGDKRRAKQGENSSTLGSSKDCRSTVCCWHGLVWSATSTMRTLAPLWKPCACAACLQGEREEDH